MWCALNRMKDLPIKFKILIVCNSFSSHTCWQFGEIPLFGQSGVSVIGVQQIPVHGAFEIETFFFFQVFC